MDLKWGDLAWDKFVSNAGLITTRNNKEDNIMCAAWTYAVSYKPGLIAVCIEPGKTSWNNIKKSKEFGVSLASPEQNVLCSIAGGNSGKRVDKIKVLEEIGYRFFEGKKAKVLLVKGSAVQFECRMIKEIEIGDHAMFVGKVLKVHSSGKDAVAFYNGKYHKLGDRVEKPGEKELNRIKGIVWKHTKKDKNNQ